MHISNHIKWFHFCLTPPEIHVILTTNNQLVNWLNSTLQLNESYVIYNFYQQEPIEHLS